VKDLVTKALHFRFCSWLLCTGESSRIGAFVFWFGRAEQKEMRTTRERKGRATQKNDVEEGENTKKEVEGPMRSSAAVPSSVLPGNFEAVHQASLGYSRHNVFITAGRYRAQQRHARYRRPLPHLRHILFNKQPSKGMPHQNRRRRQRSHHAGQVVCVALQRPRHFQIAAVAVALRSKADGDAFVAGGGEERHKIFLPAPGAVVRAMDEEQGGLRARRRGGLSGCNFDDL
jgi:hypothetical protein